MTPAQKLRKFVASQHGDTLYLTRDQAVELNGYILKLEQLKYYLKGICTKFANLEIAP